MMFTHEDLLKLEILTALDDVDRAVGEIVQAFLKLSTNIQSLSKGSVNDVEFAPIFGSMYSEIMQVMTALQFHDLLSQRLRKITSHLSPAAFEKLQAEAVTYSNCNKVELFDSAG